MGPRGRFSHAFMEELRESGQPMWREEEGEGEEEGIPLATSSAATNRDEGSSAAAAAVTVASELAKKLAPYSGAEERIGFAPGKGSITHNF